MNFHEIKTAPHVEIIDQAIDDGNLSKESFWEALDTFHKLEDLLPYYLACAALKEKLK